MPLTILACGHPRRCAEAVADTPEHSSHITISKDRPSNFLPKWQKVRGSKSLEQIFLESAREELVAGIPRARAGHRVGLDEPADDVPRRAHGPEHRIRSEEHTSELQ